MLLPGKSAERVRRDRLRQSYRERERERVRTFTRVILQQHRRAILLNLKRFRIARAVLRRGLTGSEDEHECHERKYWPSHTAKYNHPSRKQSTRLCQFARNALARRVCGGYINEVAPMTNRDSKDSKVW